MTNRLSLIGFLFVLSILSIVMVACSQAGPEARADEEKQDVVVDGEQAKDEDLTKEGDKKPENSERKILTDDNPDEMPEPGSALKNKEELAKETAERDKLRYNDSRNIYGKVPKEWIKMPGCLAWIDPTKRTVIVDGRISLTAGMLELFACTPNSKEHESVVKAYVKPSIFHAALLATRAIPGQPVRFEPEYSPPSGSEIEIFVTWIEGDEEQRVPAKKLVYNQDAEAELDVDWVFAGSMFMKPKRGGPERYLADSTGELISVSNFPESVLDIPMQVSSDNNLLEFVANTQEIPPLGTKVRMYFQPKIEAKDDPKTEKNTDSKTEPEPMKEKK